MPSSTLTRICLCDFRPFVLLDFEPTAGRNFIVGSNALGKSSLLEAVCLLLRLQSPRTTAPRECVRFGAVRFGLDGSWGDARLRVTFDDVGRKALLNDVSVTVREYLAVGKVAWMSNSDRELISGGGSLRRRFLDFLGVQIFPAYGEHLRTYERALRSRNALLRDGRSWREIAAFNVPLATAGDALRDARIHLVELLAPHVQQSYAAIARNDEPVSIVYRPACSGALAETLESTCERDTRAGLTTTGPHRDELDIFLHGHPAASFASEGQQRSLAIALKLAQAACIRHSTGATPIYLIDDVFGELDPTRRENFLAVLPRDAQMLITTTSLAWRESETDGTIFRLQADGGLVRGC